MAVKPIPDGYSSVTPYLALKGATEALAFYRQAFGATELFRMMAPNGAVVHAEIQIGDSRIMLGDECPESPIQNPSKLGGSTISLYLYVENVDALLAQAVAAGAKIIKPVQDQFYGDRSGTLQDPFGHVWSLATHKEDVSPEEIHKRATALFQKQGQPCD